MTKRSAGISELESEIRELLNESTGILETRSIARFVELMLETSSSEARSYLLRVFFSIPQTEKQTFSRFIQQNGVEILGGWITEHRASFESDDRQIVYTSLSCLNKLTLTSDHLERTQITKIVSKLTQHPDSIIQTKANTLISRWKVFFSEDQKHPKYFLDPKIPQNK
jgi:TFIIS helical bundle-like domain